jgi:RimJ/RimL family protein N-acetyltransferase
MRVPFVPPVSYVDGDLELRCYRPGDGAALNAATLASYEHLKPWMPWAKTDQTVDDAELICRRLAAKYLLGEDFTIGAWLGGEYLGGTGFHTRCGPIEWGCAEIGMWIRAEQAGKGLGTRVLGAMLEWGFGEWGWERLIWKCDTRNVASARVAEKGGMTREATFRSDALDVDGHRRDTYLYAILKSEFSKPTA